MFNNQKILCFKLKSSTGKKVLTQAAHTCNESKSFIGIAQITGLNKNIMSVLARII